MCQFGNKNNYIGVACLRNIIKSCRIVSLDCGDKYLIIIIECNGVVAKASKIDLNIIILHIRI